MVFIFNSFNIYIISSNCVMQQKHSDMHAKIYEEETEESEDNPDYLNPQPMNWESPVSMPRLVAPNNEPIFNASNMQIQNPNVMRGATNVNSMVYNNAAFQNDQPTYNNNAQVSNNNDVIRRSKKKSKTVKNDNESTLQNPQQNIQFTPDMQQQFMSRMFDMMKQEGQFVNQVNNKSGK